MGKNGVVPEMLRRHNERGFDIWLLLLRDYDGNVKGAAKVDEAFKIVAKKAPDNPKRTFGYVTGILGKM